MNTTIRNNSPYAVNTDAISTFNVPSDCTVNGGGGSVVLNAPLGVLAGGASTGMLQTASLRCTALGPHSMPVTACGILDDVFALDLNYANNCQTQNLTFDVTTLPGGDTDGDGYTDQAEIGTPLCGDGRNEDGVIAGGASDDPVIDDDCSGGPPKAGSWSEAQFNIGTDPLDSCGTDGNPADLVSGGIPSSTNSVNLLDLTSFLAPARRLDTSPGNANFNKRWDLAPGRGLFNTWINVADLTSIITVRPSAPPWYGSRAFGGPACGGIPPF